MLLHQFCSPSFWRNIMTGTYGDNSQDDRISNLPRNITDCILEHLPVQDAARTCILSRRWRYVWATHPQLRFDKQFYIENIMSKRNFQYAFERTIDKILLLHTGPILQFTLYVPLFYDRKSPDIAQWLLFLSRNGIKQLTIDFSSNHPYELPSHLFSCSELTHLDLSNCILKLPDVFPCFRKLTRLSLYRVTFLAKIIGPLFYCAPLLQVLTLVSCSGIEHYNIHASKLRGIHIHNTCDLKSISFKDTTNLTVVSIAPCCEVDSGTITDLIKFIGSIPKVEKLILDGFVLKVLAAGPVPKMKPTTIQYLRKLNFHCINLNDSDHISCVSFLLRSSPNLRELVIKVAAVSNAVIEPAANYLEEWDYVEMKLDGLRTVTFTFHKGSKAELLFIKFLLACSPSLVKLFAEFTRVLSADEGFRISKELMRFSRASRHAEIIFM